MKLAIWGLFRKIYYWHHTRKHGIPHPDEVMGLLVLEAPRLNKSHKLYRATVAYAVLGDLDLAATTEGVTRERIRQCVWKVYRRLQIEGAKTLA